MAGLSRQALIIVVSCTVLLSLSTLATVLRFVGIRILRRSIKHHDYFCIVAAICCVGYAACVLHSFAQIEFIGTNGAAVSHENTIKTPKVMFVALFFWVGGSTAFRLSTLLLYLEIFWTRKFRWWVCGCTAIVMVGFIGAVITLLVICRPISLHWDKTEDGSCAEISHLSVAGAATSAAYDAVIVLLPLPVVWKLQMSTTKKIGVSVTFALGLVISGVNIARVMEVRNCGGNRNGFCTEYGPVLLLAETAVGIMVACVPTLSVLLPKRWIASKRSRLYSCRPERFGSGGGKDSGADGATTTSQISAGGTKLMPLSTGSQQIWVSKDIRVSNRTPDFL